MIDFVLFTSEARADIAESYAWYENREPGLGEEFLRCVDGGVLNIQRHPFMHPVVADGFRRALIRRFPYEIYYELAGDSITIYSVFHSSQDPEKWRQRLTLDG